MAQLGVTRVKVDAREMRCAKEKSFLFFFFLERERGRFTFRLKSFREVKGKGWFSSLRSFHCFF